MNLPLQPSYWIIQLVGLSVTAFLLPGLKITSIFGPIFMLVSMALVNAFLWDASLFYQLPLDFNNHALTILIWNAGIFWLLVKLLPGIEISGIISPILAPILFTGITIFAGQYATKVDWENLANGVMTRVEQEKNRLKKPEVRVKPEPQKIEVTPSEKF